MTLAAFATQPLEASKAVDRQQGKGANPDQERRQRAEIAIEPERTSYMHDAPLYQPNRLSRPNPVKAPCVAPAIDLVQSAAEKGSGRSGWLGLRTRNRL